MSTKAARPATKAQPINMLAIGGGAAVGLITGGIIAGLLQLTKVQTDVEYKLDPDAPNMKEVNIELYRIFGSFMGTFMKMCPEKNQKVYQETMKECIGQCEAIMLIQNQILKDELPHVPGRKERNEVEAYAILCMRNLRQKVRFLFDNTTTIERLNLLIERVYVHLSDAILNVQYLVDK